MEDFLKDKIGNLAKSIADLNAVVSTFRQNPDAQNKIEGEIMAEVKIEETAAEVKAEVKSEVVEVAAAEVKVEEVVVPAPVVEVAEAKMDDESKEDPKEEKTETKEEEKKEAKEESKAEVVEEVKAEVVDAVLEAEAAAKKIAKESLKKAMCAEEVVELGFSDAELAFATKFSFVDLVKFVASSSAELASFKEAAEKAEAEERLQDRLVTLSEAGILFAGSDAESQKAEITDMTEEAFGSYVEKTVKVKAIFESGAGLDKTAIEAAKASVGKLSVEPKLVVSKPDYRLI